MDNFVFITGMFRSGTTFLARMINSHPAIAIASDPYAVLFKTFRNKVAEEIFGLDNIDRNAPMDDYYFYPKKQKLMKRIQQTGLDISIGNLRLSELREKIVLASGPYSPKIGPLLDALSGDTFADLIINGLEIIKRAYGDNNTELIGFKEVWIDEFAGHLLRQFPNAKVIHMVRDPRAACASKNVNKEKYPWIFLARQWRKLATIAWRNTQTSFPFCERVLLVRFEELVTNPSREARRICNFLEIEFDENVVNPSSFVDGAGNPWMQNSSHFLGKQIFNPDSVEKWKDVLAPRQVEFIESLCFAEMGVFNYQLAELKKLPPPVSSIFTPPEVAREELADWIRPYSFVEPAEQIQEMALEYLRADILTNKKSISDDEKRALCLDKEFFNFAVQLCQK